MLAQIASRGRWKRARHLEYINLKLLDVLAGRTRRLGVFAPPRHGKSDLLSVYFPALFLCTYPDRRVIMASHSATQAVKFGMQVRDIIEEFGPSIRGITVRSDRRAVDDWGIEGHRGGMRSIGVGGSLVGDGADLAIFDDILPDAQAALSETIRNGTHDWYLSTARTRINAGGVQIFTMQRWHDDDPAARIVLAHPGKWDIVNLPAIAEDGDELGRAPGEALWPEQWPLDVLEEIRDDNEFWFAAQYQQRPVPRGGGMFKESWFTGPGRMVRASEVPADADRVRFWDRASSDGKGDWTVGVKMARFGHRYFVEHVARGQWGSDERDAWIMGTARRDKDLHPNRVTIWGEQEPGSAGKDAAVAFCRMLDGHAVHCEVSSGNKVVRADGFAAACGRGDVYMVEAEWNQSFVKELSTFPFGKNDDIVDSASAAYNKLALAEDPGGYATMTQAEYERHREVVH